MIAAFFFCLSSCRLLHGISVRHRLHSFVSQKEGKLWRSERKQGHTLKLNRVDIQIAIDTDAESRNGPALHDVAFAMEFLAATAGALSDEHKIDRIHRIHSVQ